MGILRDAIAVGMDRWVRSRAPRCAEITLGHRQIFIIPNRFGLGFLVLVLVLFVMGTNYQNNLVLALAFWLVALFVLSIHLTFHNLSGLTLHAGFSEGAFVDDPVTHRVHVSSERERFDIQFSCQGEPQAWLDRLPAHDHLPVQVVTRYAHRGRHPLPRLRLETRFPFGWITAWSFWTPQQYCLIWPRPVDHGLARLAEDDLVTRPLQPQRRDTDAMDDVRDYAAGDPTRRILWRQFARRGVLQVKAPPKSSGDTRHLSLAQVADLPLEKGLEQLAYWLEESEAEGDNWSLRLGQDYLPPGQGKAQRTQGLDALALFSGGNHE